MTTCPCCKRRFERVLLIPETSQCFGLRQGLCYVCDSSWRMSAACACVEKGLSKPLPALFQFIEGGSCLHYSPEANVQL